ncbi:hypothetical protein [Corynebacterium hesseae]|nr:hypothetical protein [Corynebacterium hesseae]MCZ9298237.1 hypothetical protein [Corynebacterium hesseae]
MSQQHYEYGFGSPTERFELAVRHSFVTDPTIKEQNVESITFFAVWQKAAGFIYVNVAEITGAPPFDRVLRYSEAHERIHQNLLLDLFPPNFAGELHGLQQAQEAFNASNIVATLLVVRYDYKLDSFTYDRKDYPDHYTPPSNLEELSPIAQDLKDQSHKNAQSGQFSYPALDYAIPPAAYGNGTNGDDGGLVKQLINDVKPSIQLFNQTSSGDWDGFAMNFVVRKATGGTSLRQVDAIFCWNNGSYRIAPIPRREVHNSAVALIEQQSYGQEFELAVIRLKYRQEDGFALRIEWNGEAIPFVGSPLNSKSLVHNEWPLQ